MSMDEMVMQESLADSISTHTAGDLWKDRLTEQKVAWLLRQLKESSVSVREQVSDFHFQSLFDEKILDLLNVPGMTAVAAAESLVNELNFPLRYYAHQRSEAGVGTVKDYQETLLWQPTKKGPLPWILICRIHSVHLASKETVTLMREDSVGFTKNFPSSSQNEIVQTIRMAKVFCSVITSGIYGFFLRHRCSTLCRLETMRCTGARLRWPCRSA